MTAGTFHQARSPHKNGLRINTLCGAPHNRFVVTITAAFSARRLIT